LALKEMGFGTTWLYSTYSCFLVRLKTDKQEAPHTCLYQPHGRYRSPHGTTMQACWLWYQEFLNFDTNNVESKCLWKFSQVVVQIAWGWGQHAATCSAGGTRQNYSSELVKSV
jgi:hypothetical protein